MGKDEVAIHTLAGAAHQIIFDMNKVKGGAREMLFDSIVIKDEHRKEFVDRVKRDMNFFKHADKDPDPGSVTEFAPITTEMFFLFAIIGLGNLGEQQNDSERAYWLWILINHPNWFADDIKRKLEAPIAKQQFADMRQMGKEEFFKTALQAFALMRTGGLDGPRYVSARSSEA